MDLRKIVVIVEDVEVARTALKWALNNLMRYGDLITLLHVFPSTRSKSSSKTKVEIIVTEGDQEGRKTAAIVREIGASVLVVGLHSHSFLYKMAMEEEDLTRIFNCKVLAIKQATNTADQESQKTKNVEVIAATTNVSTNMEFSQIEITKLQAPETPMQKIPYRICPDPYAIIWRSRKSTRRWTL